jgi:hypothetical protein
MDLALKKEAVCSSKTLVDFQRDISCYTPEARTLQLNLVNILLS